jgi:toxin-antitoxin system PIN domain toxin
VTTNTAPKTTNVKKPAMIAVDTNILIDAWWKESPLHQQAADLMEGLELGTSEWAIPDSCLYEYYQLVTSLKRFEKPATPKEALGQIEFWLALPHVSILCEFADERDDQWACLTDILEYAEIKGLLMFDAHVAAVCITHHVGEFWTQDRDYAQFKGLKIRNPLAEDSHVSVFAEEGAAEQGLAGSGDGVAVDDERGDHREGPEDGVGVPGVEVEGERRDVQ